MNPNWPGSLIQEVRGGALASLSHSPHSKSQNKLRFSYVKGSRLEEEERNVNK